MAWFTWTHLGFWPQIDTDKHRLWQRNDWQGNGKGEIIPLTIIPLTLPPCLTIAKGQSIENSDELSFSNSCCHLLIVMALFNGMKHGIVPIDQAGRIVLPKNVRQELAIKPGDTFKVSIEGVAVTLTPNRERTGFVRKGKALVFSTASNETLSEETVQAILESSRAEHDFRSVEGLVSQKRRG